MDEDADTVIELPLPTKVPPQLPAYQFHTAPVPSAPPLTVKLVEPEEQTDAGDAEAEAGAEEGVFNTTGKQEGALLPHKLVAITQTLPAVEPGVTLMEVLPWPALIVQPAGTLHTYDAAFPTAAIENTCGIPAQKAAEPLMAPGVLAGVD